MQWNFVYGTKHDKMLLMSSIVETKITLNNVLKSAYDQGLLRIIGGNTQRTHGLVCLHCEYYLQVRIFKRCHEGEMKEHSESKKE